jgi:hypothetical protein
MRLDVTRLGFPAYFPLLRRGSVEVRIGEPLSFDDDVTIEDAAAAIEQAVVSL